MADGTVEAFANQAAWMQGVDARMREVSLTALNKAFKRTGHRRDWRVT